MEIATIITALAALVTGIATFFMVLEMKRQRTAISKPVIKLIADYYETVIYEQSWKLGGTDGYKPKLSIINFGTGPAFNVLVEWTIDQEILIKTLKHFDPYNQFKIKWENDVFHCDNSAHFIEKQKTHRIEALTLYNRENSTSLQIPSYYLAAYEKYIQLAFIDRPVKKSKNIEAFDCPNYPPIKAHICFEDINGSKLEQLFTLELQLFNIGSKGEDKSHSISGYIEIKEETV